MKVKATLGLGDVAGGWPEKKKYGETAYWRRAPIRAEGLQALSAIPLASNSPARGLLIFFFAGQALPHADCPVALLFLLLPAQGIVAVYFLVCQKDIADSPTLLRRVAPRLEDVVRAAEKEDREKLAALVREDVVINGRGPPSVDLVHIVYNESTGGYDITLGGGTKDARSVNIFHNHAFLGIMKR